MTHEIIEELTDTDYAREIAQKKRELNTKEGLRIADREEKEVKTKGVGEAGGARKHSIPRAPAQ